MSPQGFQTSVAACSSPPGRGRSCRAGISAWKRLPTLMWLGSEEEELHRALPPPAAPPQHPDSRLDADFGAVCHEAQPEISVHAV